jgi:AraC-like DNA-binding protein/mannose-6-phosphate isomerase-like protein (cupin superfamily)
MPLMKVPEQIPGASIGLPMLAHAGMVNLRRASRISWHSHPNYELLFLLEGATAYEFKQRRTIELHGGHFLVIPPQADHRGRHGVRAPAAICGLALNLGHGHAAQGTPFTRDDLARIQSALRSSAFTLHPLSSTLRSLLRWLREETAAYWEKPRRPDADAALRALVCTVVLEASRQMCVRPTVPKEIIASGVAFLRQHCAEPVRIPDLVRHLGFSRARVFQLFKSELGLTPNDCLQRIRIENAMDLLKDPERSITEVALATGFNSSQYFSTAFRRYTGGSPTGRRGSINL